VLGAAGAAIEQTFSALKNLLLLGERRIKRHTGRPPAPGAADKIIEPSRVRRKRDGAEPPCDVRGDGALPNNESPPDIMFDNMLFWSRQSKDLGAKPQKLFGRIEATRTGAKDRGDP
jgi:hypothetical protein